eukprot:TRINITY_DN2067_c0_g1_i2.p1 TRINITY_DN2067_c0_g1~~TRINITY_DN2067_c0_g1_i2.p1  ORF type:complete len:322 (-),score=37.57 TRINITY_DN2067_c0_g1_i2:193-1125(-)
MASRVGILPRLAPLTRGLGNLCTGLPSPMMRSSVSFLRSQPSSPVTVSSRCAMTTSQLSRHSANPRTSVGTLSARGLTISSSATSSSFSSASSLTSSTLLSFRHTRTLASTFSTSSHTSAESSSLSLFSDAFYEEQDKREAMGATGLASSLKPRGETKEATANLHGVRSSIKKTVPVMDLVRGLNYREALMRLELCEKRVAKPVQDALRFAKNAAEHNFGLNPDRLIVSEAWVGGGTYLKRIMYHARGRFGQKRRPRVHIRIKLAEVPYRAGEERLGVRGLKHKTIIDNELIREGKAVVNPNYKARRGRA